MKSLKPLLIGAVLLSGCATSGAAAPPASKPVAAPTARSPGWLTRLDASHPLVGKLWDVSGRSFVDERTLLTRAAKARFILLGERHDNPDHHRLQGLVLARLLEAGRRPALVLEMLEPEQQPLADQYLARAGANPAGLGAAVGWEKTNWPPFTDYQPIFDAAVPAKLRIAAGNLAQADVKALVKQGPAAWPAERLQQLRLTEPLPTELQATLIEELRSSHCGQLPERLLEPMALAQRARDAQLARTLLREGATDGAVLIAGGGHARRDRAVPRYLALDAPGSSVLSVSLREVRADELDPAVYAAEEGPFDFVWFTPRSSDEDPCAAFGPKKP